jgi:hypothetical protein
VDQEIGGGSGGFVDAGGLRRLGPEEKDKDPKDCNDRKDDKALDRVLEVLAVLYVLVFWQTYRTAL